jgi:hypothetical protein
VAGPAAVLPQPQGPARAPPAARLPAGLDRRLEPSDLEASWYYVDPQQVARGPFSVVQLMMLHDNLSCQPGSGVAVQRFEETLVYRQPAREEVAAAAAAARPVGELRQAQTLARLIAARVRGGS